MASDTPHVIRGTQQDYKRLYFSEPSAALKVPVSLSAGFGKLTMGTALSKDTSGTGSGEGKLFPYDPTTTITGAENAPGRAYILANTSATVPTVHVTIDDSYKFRVGDDLIINDDTTDAENLGAITSIDRTTYTNYAVITATTNIGGTAFTTARFGYVTLEGYDACVGVLEKSVDTGTGKDSKGAVATLILGNCVLYTGTLLNLDSAARTDISAAQFGNYTYIR